MLPFLLNHLDAEPLAWFVHRIPYVPGPFSGKISVDGLNFRSMQTFTLTESSMAWQSLRHLYPVYSALAHEFVIDTQPCRELEGGPVPSADAIEAARKWFSVMDDRIQIHQLRQFLQTSGQIDEAILRELLVHHLNKAERTEHDRDKVDFLLVQLLSERAPSDLSGPRLSLAEAARILEPVLGVVEITQPPWIAPLEDLLDTAYRAHTLNEVFTARIIERGRQIKLSCGIEFFEPTAMVAFARFGFLVRRAFFRLMHQDLNASLDGLRKLETQGLTTLDCRKAQFSADEPIARLRMICQSWKVMFHAEYSSGQPLCILVDLRTAVEAALAHQARQVGAPLKSQAAGASGAEEFEVGGPSSWDGDVTG
jgi:hypothetical protein